MKQGKTKILIGTSGFSYPDWVGPFYPPDLKKDNWLEFYANNFEFCELNFSYYRMPQEHQMEKFLEHPLRYAIKAHRSMTHERVPAKVAREDFYKAVSVLLQDDHLAVVLLQFPFSFAYTPENRLYLKELLSDLHPLPLVVEFRNPNWIRQSVFDALKENGWGVSLMDSPKVKGGMPDFDAVTSEIAYLRFHGRNAKNWWDGNNVSRYDYDYNKGELEEWLPRIKGMAHKAKTIYISFNNHARGQAIQNANLLKSMIWKT